ncbi:MAG: hypothetical protein NDJ89_09875 [Oligoflexia bacterium]|nr:hypothetical protein [Oligoflexia bacterium]
MASAALNAPLSRDGVDWVVAREFAPVLRGHPAIRKLWEFDRREGLRGWLRLCRELRNQNYDEIHDLHRTLRTRLAWIFLSLASIFSERPRWKTFPKDRWKMQGYFIFKRFWPKALRPVLFVERFARELGGSGHERPDLKHLLHLEDARLPAEFQALLDSGRPYYCVMPSSHWPGKRWNASAYAELLLRIPGFPVVLGTLKDHESLLLVQELSKNGREHLSGINLLQLPQTARILARSKAYLGSDTGLAHLAEAVGIPALVILGPTVSDLGFGPWRPESRSVGLALGCRPCSKDGRACFRVIRRHACLKELRPELAETVFSKILEDKEDSR